MIKKILKVLFFLLFVALLVFASFSLATKTADKTYQERVLQEKQENNQELDVYKMQKYARENAKKVLDALKDDDYDKLKEIIRKPTNIEKMLKSAEWSELDESDITSFGTGSFTSKPNKNGKMDVGEQMSLSIKGEKYAFYVQTVTSRFGKINDGVSCVALTSFKHFDEIDYAWHWQTDDNTLRAGTPFN